MSEPVKIENNQTTATAPEAPQERTFTQAELDSILGKRLAKALKGMPGEEELTAFRAWKESQQSEQERWDTLTTERDTARTELTAAQAKIEQYEREKLLLSKGVPADDVDYYAFKIGKLMTDDTDFETAAAQYLRDHAPKPAEIPTMRVEMGGPLSSNGGPQSLNEIINSKLRGR